MHPHGNASAEPAPRRAAAPPPPTGNVHGLGVVDALRIDFEPGQLPWLAAEIDTLRYCLEDELAHSCARYYELPDAAKQDRRGPAREAERELERRAYQLQALAMICEQVPISREAVAAAVASPWRKPVDDITPAAARVEGPPIAVVGPAALMTVLIRGATRNVADALGEALRGPDLDVDAHTDSAGGWRGAELPRVTPAIAEKLRRLAAAARAFTDTYLDLVALQAYSFDPVYQPVAADELE
jgi:hypothetical protein